MYISRLLLFILIFMLKLIIINVIDWKKRENVRCNCILKSIFFMCGILEEKFLITRIQVQITEN